MGGGGQGSCSSARRRGRRGKKKNTGGGEKRDLFAKKKKTGELEGGGTEGGGREGDKCQHPKRRKDQLFTHNFIEKGRGKKKKNLNHSPLGESFLESGPLLKRKTRL